MEPAGAPRSVQRLRHAATPRRAGSGTSRAAPAALHIAVLRAEPGLFGRVASDPTMSRVIDRLAATPDTALCAIGAARATARARAWSLAGVHAPDHTISAGSPLVIDIDATLLTAHSDKEGAAPTFKRGFGHHPLWTFVDHGPGGTGEPLSVLLRPGNAGSNTAADHITVLREALRQLPSRRTGTRPGRKILIRADSAGATHDLLDWITGQRLSCSVGFTLPDTALDVLNALPPQRGNRPTTPTANHARVTRLSSSPGCWTCAGGRPG